MIQHDIISRVPKNASPANPKSASSAGDMAAMLAEARSRMETWSLDQLLAFVKESDNNLARWFAERAVAISLIEKKQGKPMTGVPYLSLFRRVARGETVPELAVLFLTKSRSIADPIYHLPIQEQKKLAAKPVVPVYEPGVGGKLDTRMVDLTQASAAVINQVISPEGIRSPEEQKAHLAITQKVTPAMKVEKVIAQTAAKYIDEDVPSEDLDYSIPLKLTKSEYRMICDSAIEQGLTKGQMVRRLMLRSGALNALKSKRQPVSC